MGKEKPTLKSKTGKGKPYKKTEETDKDPLLVSRPKNFAIGNDLPPKRDVTRFVRWPKYVTRQRQKRVLERRLKVPPTLNMFRLTLDKGTKSELFKLMAKYRPEDKKTRDARLKTEAAKKKENPKAALSKKPTCIKYGIQQVTRMVEEKRAKLVVIAHDVDPIEIVLWMPALCKAQGVPYCIVKGKSALGKLVNLKTCSCAAFDAVNSEDNSTFARIQDSCNSGFLDAYDEQRKHYGGLQLGTKGRKTKE
ncbi:60S ribosomal protein L7a-1 [Diplonema papillatum]|nr:60S ribosomal protein L7a-1 [Diplonema papillatum]KAJ9452846.1 60S ribosomal protein L7a-1 [Diplonema papillatum]KAJ9452847.1 60S ribosomal protein L7a-1 [Diplonema papillatum]KAJ9452848.1 60S ribosomal protein L7a-1 [Diplonema papillatum]KAJ9452849.1 60S ribosomal protein L7a-1 [Diplonema papillatum]|eukprot:TRINITY_DN54179_c0_g1_i1.p1 TRINITY_DN54179_c0_g1~~TRINITY_DN54179_c0_g1_i1.p1  ORF type:complete len:250 (+),score=57.81 TRINITY_DN54179_c0_g1_i1:24-773(+)